jgi:hypothetical protein
MSKTKNTAPKPFCFVLMPFDPSFDDVYKIGIKEACEDAGAYCERVDEQIFNERILDRIYNQIAKADIIIADMTGRNANVFYEVGYAHALNKLTILLTKNADDIPFDLKHFPHIVYGSSISGLRDDLTKRVRHYVETPPGHSADAKLEAEVFLDGKALGHENMIIGYKQRGPGFMILVQNHGPRTLQPGDIRIGLITTKGLSSLRGYGTGLVAGIDLPDGRLMHMLPDFKPIYPTGVDTLGAYFIADRSMRVEEPVEIRVFTHNDVRSYTVTLKPDN